MKINNYKKRYTNLNESLEAGISVTLRDLISQENELLNQYESAKVTFNENDEHKFDDIIDYIIDDINIHIGMLQAAIEDINPSAEKIDDGKDQGEDLIA